MSSIKQILSELAGLKSQWTRVKQEGIEKERRARVLKANRADRKAARFMVKQNAVGRKEAARTEAESRLPLERRTKKKPCSEPYCKTPDSPVITGPDPYRADLFSDYTPVALCEDCRLQKSLDI
jgi:hypothetical protein